MIEKRIITDLSSCRALWELMIRPRNVSDIWEFRLCFHRRFNRPPCFVLLEDKDGVAGMLPLCYVEEEDAFAFFPGETWKGKTWLERTPFYWRDRESLSHLLAACPERTYLRYMEAPDNGALGQALEVDELGYLLYPPSLGFDIARYLERFSTKRLKNITKEINAVLVPDGVFCPAHSDDLDWLLDMNIQRFGCDSYFFDHRFREGFRDVMCFLQGRGMLRMVKLKVRGETAAVDLGAVNGQTYSVFMGGTHPGFPGVAKAMNMHHIEFAFTRRLSRVDFLCGDFHWKKLWHLDPEPLYKFVTPALRRVEDIKKGVDHDPACVEAVLDVHLSGARGLSLEI